MVMKDDASRYMLLGVLVDVIGAVASTEKQKIEITYIVTWSRSTEQEPPQWLPVYTDIHIYNDIYILCKVLYVYKTQ